ncbi:L,D-transpeptidase [Patulibacter sp.]|uniref:L,D-transpeptidase n=1 Tax=Patulibacter sp. TaxID=1912859 RepID=UPI0027157036|nr:L,D-transpeptidase [Patulibacter sp.]MDO9410546.1 L,D-transpeptidase [Patulibacter sp.]
MPAPTVELLRDLTVFAAPEVGARRTGAVAARRPITHGRTVLPVLQAQTDAVGHRWVRVLLPGRPNGRSGWIRTRSTRAAVTPWSVDIDRAARSGVVRRLGVVVRRFRVIVGAPSTPTPVGRFFVEESIRLPGGRVAGPFALALSSRSEVLQEFAGGPGQIALHGRDGLGGTLGTAVSHGCMRLGRADVAWLAARVGPGARVTVRSRGTGPTTGTATATRGASSDDRTTPGTTATDTSSTTTGPGR